MLQSKPLRKRVLKRSRVEPHYLTALFPGYSAWRLPEQEYGIARECLWILPVRFENFENATARLEAQTPGGKRRVAKAEVQLAIWTSSSSHSKR
jgi:hypothetical protein